MRNVELSLVSTTVKRIHNEYAAAVAQVREKGHDFTKLERDIGPDLLKQFIEYSSGKGGEKFRPDSSKFICKAIFPLHDEI